MIAVDSLQEKQLWAWQLATRIYVQDPTGLRDQRHLLHTRGIYCLITVYWTRWVPSDDSTENNTTSVGGIVKYFWQTHKRTLKKNPRGFQASFCAAIGFKPSFSNFFSKASSHRLENGLRCYYCPSCCLKPALFEAHHSLIDFCKPNSWTKCNIHLDSHWRHWESIFSIFYQLICYWHFRISTAQGHSKSQRWHAFHLQFDCITGGRTKTCRRRVEVANWPSQSFQPYLNIQVQWSTTPSPQNKKQHICVYMYI